PAPRVTPTSPFPFLPPSLPSPPTPHDRLQLHTLPQEGLLPFPLSCASLATTFPRRLLPLASSASVSLEQADLCPRAVLVVEEEVDENEGQGEQQQQQPLRPNPSPARYSSFSRALPTLPPCRFPTLLPFSHTPAVFTHLSGAGLQEQQRQLCCGRVALDYIVDATRHWRGSSSPPLLPLPPPQSFRQVLDCKNSSSSCAAGGWPTAALDYMVDATTQWGGLACEAGYTYTQKDGKCNRGKAKQQATAMGITGYDQVDFYGWLGLLLAVSVQPTIAFVRGSYPSFQTYTNGIYWDQGCAAAGVVDHSVVVMGYSISSDGAYWIIRNSWGSKWGMQRAGAVMGMGYSFSLQGAYWIIRNSWGAKWGMQGYMQMAFGGGTGICGIHSVPAIYPVSKTPSPCLSPQNPCGGGTCEDAGNGGYTCTCLDPLFIAIADKGGTQTCVFVVHKREWLLYPRTPHPTPSPLHLSFPLLPPPLPRAPCQLTCAVCRTTIRAPNRSSPSLPLPPTPPPPIPSHPMHLRPSPLSSPRPCPPAPPRAPCQLTCAACRTTIRGYRPNGAHTCVPTIYPSYTVSFLIDINCPLVYQLYGLTEEVFLAQNLQLNMEHCYTIPANTQVSVAPPLMGAVHCVVYYSWTSQDTCECVADNFWLTVDDLLVLNPGINCTDSTACKAPCVNQQVRCAAMWCSAVQCGARCTMLGGVADNFWLTVDDLLALNPGINCTDSTAWNAPCVNQQLCVAKGSGGSDLPKLPMCTAWYTVQSGDTCESIMKDYALNQTAFFSLNPGVGCDSLFPSIGGGAFGWSGDGVQVCVDAYLADPSSPLKPRSVRELPSTSPLLPSSLSSPSSSFSPSSSSFPTRGRLLGLSTTSHPSPASMTRLPTLIPSHADQPMRGRQLAVTKRRCLAFYWVARGDFCARIISLKFQNSARKMAELNNGYVCNNDRLYVGLSLCTRR
ncbi:unnamed protein product, partial [Closterium sp. NIES-54]